MDGRNVVFFSGGLDSTLTALELLRSNKSVVLINFDNADIGSSRQQNLENMAMKKIIKRMKNEFGDDMITTVNYTWDGGLVANIQKDIWVSLFPLALQDDDKAYFSIIRHSDFWHFKEKFEKAFYAILDCHGKKNVELLYPLEWELKKTIRKKLKKYGYYDITIHSGDNL